MPQYYVETAEETAARRAEEAAALKAQLAAPRGMMEMPEDPPRISASRKVSTHL